MPNGEQERKEKKDQQASRRHTIAFYDDENIDGRSANDEQCACSFALYAFTIFIISDEFERFTDCTSAIRSTVLQETANALSMGCCCLFNVNCKRQEKIN